MLGFDQREELDPVAVLEGVLVELLRKVDNDGGFLDLLLDLLGQGLALTVHKLVLGQLDLEVVHDFCD